ncbi:FkbM family methyltransferase [Halogeometricum borinquense]|uniref:FkbM family methyltransferase n=1 Tax=Halogeometricum borinquense TaxID=60847 RepID=A0A482TLE6_9EURY|nr:FkbM family methyltransferase [Halogeometricum borinquense]RYJ13705.1 FkbM family methyltransferase [Halogeometricum borinquense]
MTARVSVLGRDINLRWWYLRLRYQLSSRVQSRTVDSVTAKFVPTTFHEYRRINTLTEERDVVADILSELRPDDIFYDVGANIGTHSCFAGQVAAETHSFEPHPETARSLQTNLRQNGGTFEVHQVALSNSNGTAKLGLPEGDNEELGVGTFTLLDSSDHAETWEVELAVGDEYVESSGIAPPTVTKIDVEGAELDVIEGFTQALSEARVIYCEVHLESVPLEAVTSRFDELGFDSSELFRRDGTVFVKATKT